MEKSGFIVLIVGMILSRIISERGYRLLSDEEKIRLMDGFSKTRAYSMIPVLIIIGGYYLLLTKTDLEKSLVTLVYFALLVAFVIFSSIRNLKKTKSLGLPEGYQKYFMISQIVTLISFAWFFYALVAQKYLR